MNDARMFFFHHLKYECLVWNLNALLNTPSSYFFFVDKQANKASTVFISALTFFSMVENKQRSRFTWTLLLKKLLEEKEKRKKWMNVCAPT